MASEPAVTGESGPRPLLGQEGSLCVCRRATSKRQGFMWCCSKCPESHTERCSATASEARKADRRG